MNRTRIKICGLRTMEDVGIVNEAEPDLAGFIFDPSRKRYIAPEQAAILRKRLKPGIRTVGVFVNPTMEMVQAYLARCPVDLLQLHGQETNGWIRELKSELEQGRIIKAFTIRSVEDLKAAQDSAADLVLLDHGAGGTGESFDWSLIRDFPRPFLLAGGLNPENVAEAIRRTHPWGVDASSGLEGADGHKDAAKVQRFVKAVRAADAEN